MSMVVIDKVLSVQDPEQDDEDIGIIIGHTGTIIWNYHKFVSFQSKKGGAKNVTCTVCDNTFTGCSSSRAVAHFLGRPVLRQNKINIKFCAPIRKDDDNQYAQFRTAQKVLNKEMMSSYVQGSTGQFLESNAICFEFNISRKTYCGWRNENC